MGVPKSGARTPVSRSSTSCPKDAKKAPAETEALFCESPGVGRKMTIPRGVAPNCVGDGATLAAVTYDEWACLMSGYDLPELPVRRPGWMGHSSGGVTQARPDLRCGFAAQTVGDSCEVPFMQTRAEGRTP
jgi:hypothetical protein